LEEWDNAQSDINLCIEKAEENEPKYFYLRGLTYAVMKDLRRAINEYSISLSLNPEFLISLLERAKCYFLLG
jgi:tetratricopeptide (TPR) repeat protein